MSTPAEVRYAGAGDAAAIAELAAQLGYPTDELAAGRRLAVLCGRRDHAVFVAVRNDPVALVGPVERVAGWVHVFQSLHLEAEPFAELAALVVDETCRGQSIGRLLVRTAEAWARRRGLTTLRLRSNLVRADAHRFYRRLGYEVIKQQAAFSKRLE